MTNPVGKNAVLNSPHCIGHTREKHSCYWRSSSVNYRARSFASGKKVSLCHNPLTSMRALAKFRTSPLYASFEKNR